MQHARAIAAVALAVGALACSNPSEPITPKATVLVAANIIGVERHTDGAASWIEFSVPVMITNRSIVAIDQPECSYRIETPSGSGWKTTYTPVCLLSDVAGGGRRILPGETREFRLGVFAVVDGAAYSQWDAPGVDGTYRVAVGLMPPSKGGTIPFVASNSFDIREGVTAGQP